jgi:methyl coenzyme M reductase subunit C-like uncharacterized protein (methanogenesis marker protein 7)
MPETIADVAPRMAAAHESGERELCYLGRMLRQHGVHSGVLGSARYVDRRDGVNGDDSRRRVLAGGAHY